MTETIYTDNVLIDGSRDIEQLRVQGHSTQNDALQTWEDSAGDVLVQVSGDGRLLVGDDVGLASPDALIEAHRADTSSSKPKRGFHSLGQVSGTLATLVQWIIGELELKGSSAIDALHTALRIRVTNKNTGTPTSSAELRAADVEVVNDSTAGTAALTKATGLQVAVTNAADKTITDAAALRLKLNNAGTITNPYAIYSEGPGVTHLEDYVEVKRPSSVPGTPATDFMRVYPKSDGKLYAKNWSGTEYDLTGGDAPPDAKYWVSEADATLTGEINLGALSSGLLKHTVASGVSTPATATPGTDYLGPDSASYEVIQDMIAAFLAAGANINLAYDDSGNTLTINGLDYLFRPCRVVFVSNVNIASAPFTVEGISLNTGDRLLLTAQTTASQNGIWVFNGPDNALSRPTDYASGNTFLARQDMVVFIKEGDLNGASTWMLTTTGTITIDTTSTTWSKLNANFDNAVIDNGLTVNSQTLVVDDSADAVGVGTAAPYASAKFHVVSTTKGAISRPVMTAAQVAAIASPAEGLRAYESDTEHEAVYDGQRFRSLGKVGWAPHAFPVWHDAAAAFAATTALAANGGSLAVAINVPAHMLLQSVSVRQTGVTGARTWGWDLYEQYLNNGNSGENTLTRVAASNGTDSFTAGGASMRTLDVASAPVYLAPGVYWLVIQNRHASIVFHIGTTAGAVLAAGGNYQTKTTTNPNGSTLDFVAATWAKSTSFVGVMLNGRVFGETAAF